MSTLTIVLLVLGGLLLAGIGTCAAGAFWLKSKAEGALSELADGGGIVMASPPAVLAELAGARKDYVGDWRGANGNELVIHAVDHGEPLSTVAEVAKDVIKAVIDPRRRTA